MGLVRGPPKLPHQPCVCASRWPPTGESLHPPRLRVLNIKSARGPPRCAGDCPCALSVAASTVRLGQDRLRYALGSGTVRVFKVPRIEQKGQADHQVNPGGEGRKCLDGVPDEGNTCKNSLVSTAGQWNKDDMPSKNSQKRSLYSCLMVMILVG